MTGLNAQISPAKRTNGLITAVPVPKARPRKVGHVPDEVTPDGLKVGAPVGTGAAIPAPMVGRPDPAY